MSFSFLKKIGYFVLILGLFLIPSSVFGAGKMTVPLNERVNLQVDSSDMNEQYRWVVLDDRENIVYVSEGKYFTHVFKEAGIYIVNVQLTNVQTRDIQNTQVEINVGGIRRATSDDSLVSIENIIQTIPKADKRGVIHLSRKGGEVTYFAFPDDLVRSFHVDKDLDQDTNLDLDPKNDIDNENELLIIPFAVYYDPLRQTVRSQSTIVTLEGQTYSKSFTIQFDKENLPAVPARAILRTIPAPLADQKVHLEGDKGDVLFDLSLSEGDIVEYQIDTNIFEDSDGNGVSDDDIDNAGDLSLKAGVPFSASYVKGNTKMIAQASLVLQDGTVIQIQKEISFGKELPFVLDFAVRSDPIYVGDQLVFQNMTSHPPELDMAYGWDFDGDKQLDQKTLDTEVSYVYEAAGTYKVTLYARDRDGNADSLTKKVIIVDVESNNELPQSDIVIPDFDYQIDSKNVEFTDLSQILDPKYDKDQLTYSWNFGDGEYSTISNPTHGYNSEGIFTVVLSVTDASGTEYKATKDVQILFDEVITQTGTTPPVDTSSNDDSTSLSDKTPDPSTPLWLFLLKILGGIILFVVILVLVSLFFGIFYIRRHHPDLSISESWLELKEQISNFFSGGSLSIAPPQANLPDEIIVPKIPSDEEIKQSDEEAVVTPHVEKKPLEVEEGEKPSWLKQADQQSSAPTPSAVEKAPSATTPEKSEKSAPIEEEKPTEETISTEKSAETNENVSVSDDDSSESLNANEIPDWLKPTNASDADDVKTEEKVETEEKLDKDETKDPEQVSENLAEEKLASTDINFESDDDDDDFDLNLFDDEDEVENEAENETKDAEDDLGLDFLDDDSGDEDTEEIDPILSEDTPEEDTKIEEDVVTPIVEETTEEDTATPIVEETTEEDTKIEEKKEKASDVEPSVPDWLKAGDTTKPDITESPSKDSPAKPPKKEAPKPQKEEKSTQGSDQKKSHPRHKNNKNRNSQEKWRDKNGQKAKNAKKTVSQSQHKKSFKRERDAFKAYGPRKKQMTPKDSSSILQKKTPKKISPEGKSGAIPPWLKTPGQVQQKEPPQTKEPPKDPPTPEQTPPKESGSDPKPGELYDIPPVDDSK